MNSRKFTAPFRVLSDEGIRVLRAILERERREGFFKPDRRIQLLLRGVAYRSKWIRDFSTSEELRNLACKLSGEDLVIHQMPSNWCHTNCGFVVEDSSKATEVDRWHRDSVSHVVVILMSDLTTATGGDLELYLGDPDDALQALRAGRPDANMIVNAGLRTIGSAVFMKGCEVVHHVTPMVRSEEDRYTVVQSFGPRTMDEHPERTRWEAYSKSVSEAYAAHEYLNWYKAPRLANQLMNLRNNAWDEDVTKVTAEARRIARELLRACDLVEGKIEEEKVYV